METRTHRRIGRTAALALGVILILGLVPSTAVAAAGDLDSSFGNDGYTSLGYSVGFRGSEVAVQRDGKIVVLTDSAYLARYTSSGILDPTFGGGGIAATPLAHHGSDDQGDRWWRRPRLALQDDAGEQKILVGGPGSDGRSLTRPPALTVWRLRSDGSLDPTFGIGGTATDEAQTPGTHAKLLTTPEGKIVQVATLTPLGGPNTCFFSTCTPTTRSAGMVVMRNPDGKLDPTFGVAGRFLFRPPVANFEHVRLTDAAIQPDGKIVVSGEIGYNHTRIKTFFFRLLPLGTPDPSFGQDGYVELGDVPLRSPRFGIDGDGRIVVAGMTGCTYDYYYNDCKMQLAWLSAAGGLERTSVGPTYPEIYEYYEGVDWSNSASVSSVLLDQGRIVVVSAGGITRFTGDGSVLGTNGTGGWRNATLQGDGKIVTTGGMYGTLVARYMGDGGSNEPPPATATISGWVTDQATNGAVQGAAIDCGDGFTATTDSGGGYTIASVPTGTRHCTASAPGYQSKKQPVHVVEPYTQADFALRKGR